MTLSAAVRHLAAARSLVPVLRLDQAGVGGRVRRRGSWLAAIPAQYGHDLLAEQVELVQHGLQRQAGVVHQGSGAGSAEVLRKVSVLSMTSCGYPPTAG